MTNPRPLATKASWRRAKVELLELEERDAHALLLAAARLFAISVGPDTLNQLGIRAKQWHEAKERPR